MKTLLKPLAVALLFAGTASIALSAQSALAAAPAAAGGVDGIGYANLEAVVQNSNAAKTATSQRQVTYKPQIDQYNARVESIDAQLKPLADKFQRDRAAGVAPATLQQEVAAIQQIQEAGKAELQKIMEPVTLSEAYGQEQISAKLQTAVPAAMQRAGVTLLLRQEGIIYGTPAANINDAVLAELNAELPSVSIVPPAGWEPAEVREQRAQQAAQAGARGTGDTGGR